MLITGHTEILADALRHLPTDVFRVLHHYPNCSHEMLHIGLRYPDVPCANKSVADGRVTMENYKTCSWWKLTKLLRTKTGLRNELYSEAYVSHSFSLAHLHSMSFHPLQSVHMVLENVLVQASIFAAMAVCDDTAAGDQRGAPNAFWLGQLLHMVQDSYSPAHVLRLCTLPKRRRRQPMLDALSLVSSAKMVGPTYSDLSTNILVWLIEAAATRAAATASSRRRVGSAAVPRLVAQEAQRHGLDATTFIESKKQAKYARNLFVTLFLFASAKATMAASKPRVTRLGTCDAVVKRMRNHQRTYAVASRGTVDTDIVSFHVYSMQSPVTHGLQDTLASVRNVGLLSQAVQDTTVLIAMYREVILELQSVGTGAMAQRRALCHCFVTEVRSFLSRKTYRVHPGCAQLLTGLDVDLIQKELVA